MEETVKYNKYPISTHEQDGKIYKIYYTDINGDSECLKTELFINLNENKKAFICKQSTPLLQRQSSLYTSENSNRILKCPKSLPAELKMCLQFQGNEIIISSNGKEYKLGGRPSSGTYGDVNKYISDDSDIIVIKTLKVLKNYIEEKLISIFNLRLQIENEKKFNIISSYWYEEKDINKFGIIMHGKQGDLENLITNVANYNYKDIFIQIANGVYELIKNDIFFCDLKLKNVLYEIDSNGKIICFLADIGGIYNNSPRYSNLLHEDLLDDEFMLEKENETFETFLLKYKTSVDEDFIKIGYLTNMDLIKHYTTNVEKVQLKDEVNHKYKIVRNDGEIMIQNITSNNYYYGTISFISLSAVFTFPHPANPSGFLELNPEDLTSEEIYFMLINNILQSLGVMFIQILLKNNNWEFMKEFRYHNIRSTDNNKSINDLISKVWALHLDDIKYINIKKLINKLLSRDKDYIYFTKDMTIKIFEEILTLCKLI